MNKTSILMLASGIFLLDIAMKSLNDDINPNAQSSAGKVYIPRDDASRDWLDASVVSWEQIAEHYAPSEGIGDWQKLHSERHWKEGHSAYELASSWENANPDLPPEIQSLFHGPVKLLAATPEHKTPLRGRGAASQSDVLAFIGIRDRVCALAIEGKVGEGFGKIIKDWSTNASANAKKRLEFLSDTLGIKPVDKLPYQLFHRTAAAVLEARHFKADCAAMIVQSFSPVQTSFDDFAKLINAFGIDSVKPNKLYKTDKAGIDLYLGWADSPNSTLVATIPPAIPAPKESSGILRTYTKYKIEVNSALVLMLIVLLLYFMWWYTRKDSSSMGKTQKATNADPETDKVSVSSASSNPDLEAAEAVGLSSVDMQERIKKLESELEEERKIKKPTKDQQKEIDGKNFEKYTISKFRNANAKIKYFELLDWASDNITEDGIYPKRNLLPDLFYNFRFRSENYPFAVECKWKKDFYKSGVEFNVDQIKRYKTFQEHKRKADVRHKTFIVLGIGRYSNDPKKIYIIPIEDFFENGIVENKFSIEQLDSHYFQNGKNDSFFYAVQDEYLKLL